MEVGRLKCADAYILSGQFHFIIFPWEFNCVALKEKPDSRTPNGEALAQSGKEIIPIVINKSSIGVV